jgi:hypothetical protein
VAGHALHVAHHAPEELMSSFSDSVEINLRFGKRARRVKDSGI